MEKEYRMWVKIDKFGGETWYQVVHVDFEENTIEVYDHDFESYVEMYFDKEIELKFKEKVSE